MISQILITTNQSYTSIVEIDGKLAWKGLVLNDPKEDAEKPSMRDS